MKKLADRLESIEGKIKKLAHKYEILKKENLLLMEENIRLKQYANKNKTEPKTADVKGSEVSSPTLSTGMTVQQGENVRKEIDKYLTEIDHCIQQLQSL